MSLSPLAFHLPGVSCTFFKHADSGMGELPEMSAVCTLAPQRHNLFLGKASHLVLWLANTD